MITSHVLDELELSLITRGNCCEFADVVLMAPAQVEVHYDIQPGQELILRPDPNDSQEGFPAQCEVYKVIASEVMMFDAEGITLSIAAGEEITHLLKRSTVDEIEESILAGTHDDYEPDYSELEAA